MISNIRTARRNFFRALPVMLPLSPIGFIFGILAARHDWSPLSAALLSALGFSGSGQFVLFALKDQEVGWLASLAIILLINLRYIPMSITSNRSLTGGLLQRGIVSHFLCDEAYAIERPEDKTSDKTAIRLWIGSSWIIASFLGAYFVSAIPKDVADFLGDFSFPASALLVLLALMRSRDVMDGYRRKAGLWLGLATLGAALCYRLFGAQFFWLPSIVISYIILSKGLKK